MNILKEWQAAMVQSGKSMTRDELSDRCFDLATSKSLTELEKTELLNIRAEIAKRKQTGK